jgi:uncharacterized membrane protein
MSIVLRPLSTSELLDRAFFLYRNNFVVFVCISVMSHLPVLALRLANSARVAARIRVSRPAELTVLLMATFLAMAVSHAATTVAVSDLHLDHAASVRSSYRRARRTLFRVIWISFVVTLLVPFLIAVPTAILVGMVLLPLGTARLGGGVLPGLILLVVGFGAATYWWLARALVVPVTVIEGTGLRDMDRSLILTVNRRGRILLICILVVVLTWGMTALFQLPAVATGGLHFVHGRLTTNALSAAVMAVGSFVGASLAGPLLTIALTLAYYDARVRKEGFDLELMMSNLAGMPQSEAAANV